MLSFCIVTNQKSRINSRSLHRVIAYTMVSVISTLMLDVSHAIEVLVFYVCWWCKIPYSSCIFNIVVVVACVIFIPGCSRCCCGYWV